MSLIMDEADAFTANLFFQGRPVVLNQQRLKLRLRDPRLSRRERLDVEVALADSESASVLTVADHEDDKPLLLKFVPKANHYAVMTILKGEYDERFLSINAKTRHVFTGDERNSEFSLSKGTIPSARFSDLDGGASYIHLAAAESLVYITSNKSNRYFMNAEPNKTKHDAFNNTPALFVLKIVERPDELNG